MKYRLGDLCNIVSGGTPSRSRGDYWESGTIPWVKISDIRGKHISKTEEHITKAGLDSSSAKMLTKGTIVYSIFATLGEVGILDIEACTNQAIAGITIKNPTDLLTDYLFYYLLSKKQFVKEAGRGVAQNNINMSILRDFVIPLPEIKTQKHIVDVLNEAESLIERRKSEMRNLDTLIKARFVELFGDPVSNPKGWKKKALSEEADIKIGPFGSLLHREDYVSGGHALVNPSHIVEGKISTDANLTLTDEKYEELSPYHLLPGDVVMGRRGEMGRCAVVEQEGLLCGTGSLLIRTKGDLSADYIQKIISFPSFKRTIEDMAVGQTMPNLNVPIVSRFQIIKPPKSVQDEYYAFVTQVDKSKVVAQKALDKTQHLFDSLMQKYFG